MIKLLNKDTSNNNIIKFLHAISENRESFNSFRDDPDSFMNKYSLSNTEKEAIKSGDPAKIRKLMGDCGPALPPVVSFI